jgi:hypothetical protein
LRHELRSKKATSRRGRWPLRCCLLGDPNAATTQAIRAEQPRSELDIASENLEFILRHPLLFMDCEEDEAFVAWARALPVDPELAAFVKEIDHLSDDEFRRAIEVWLDNRHGKLAS